MRILHDLGKHAVWIAAVVGLASQVSAEWPQFKYVPVANVPSGTQITAAGDGSGRLFATSQPGVIHVWQGGPASPFLDLTARVLSGGERGLLGLAFPPGYATKRYFYVNYTRKPDGATVVSRFHVPAGTPNAADPGSEEIILVVPQPAANHNGGHLAFGPDGFLYIGMGDGGGTFFDQPNHAQNPASLLGKMLRLEVESGISPYQIPRSNPFVSNPEFRPEIWARGLRNPWRFSFDRQTGDLYIADVGEFYWEEINFLPAGSPGGQNYGWRICEGAHIATEIPPGFDLSTLTGPVAEYMHGADQGSITGGYVYRGTQLPHAFGRYFCADFSGRIFGLRRQGKTWELQRLENAGFAVTTFGEDEAGELYVADYFGGRILRVESDNVVRPVTFDLVGGPYPRPVPIRGTCDTFGSVVRYTLDGTEPTEASPTMPADGVVIDGAATLRARGYRPGFTPGPVASQAYQFQVTALESNASSGVIYPGNGRSVNFTSETPGTTIHYTLDGTTPTTASPVYTEPIFLSMGPATVKAFGRRAGYGDTTVLTLVFTMANQSPPSVFPPGQLNNGTPAILLSSSYQPEIRYTLDGSTPNRSSLLYQGPLYLNGLTVISVISYAAGYFDSAVTVTTCFPVNQSPGAYDQKAGGNPEGYVDAPLGSNARFRHPEGICLESDASVLVADTGNHAIRRVLASGTVTTLAGNGTSGYIDGPGPDARFSWPSALCRGREGDFFVADTGNRRIRRIAATGEVSTYAGSGQAGSADGPALEAQFEALGELQMDASGFLYVGAAGRIRRISPGGQVSTVATLPGTSRVCLALVPDGRLYASQEGPFLYEIVGGQAVVSAGSVPGYSDGTTSTARLSDVRALAGDRLGNVAFGDADRVRRIYPHGEVVTLLANGHTTYGMAVDSVGALWIATGNRIIRYAPFDWDRDGILDGAEGGASPFIVGVDDRLVDSDGDGLSNSAEYLAGSNPLLASSVFRPNFGLVAGRPTLTWPSINARRYWVEYSSDLRTWYRLYEITGTGFNVQATDFSALVGSRYYRLRFPFP